jgi:hypothetical protein
LSALAPVAVSFQMGEGLSSNCDEVGS